MNTSRDKLYHKHLFLGIKHIKSKNEI